MRAEVALELGLRQVGGIKVAARRRGRDTDEWRIVMYQLVAAAVDAQKPAQIASRDALIGA